MKQAKTDKRKFIYQIKPKYRSASRMFGFTLTLGTEASWLEFAAVMSARLSALERAGLAWGSLMSLDPDQIEKVCNAAMDSAGMPQAAFLGVKDQAVFWANMATENELKSYALASFNGCPLRTNSHFWAS